MFLYKNNTPRWIIVVLDLFMSIFALFLAYLIRFDIKIDEKTIIEEWSILSKSIWVFILVKLIVLTSFKIHKGLVRHTSFEDLRRIVLATSVSTLVFSILSYGRYHYIDQLYLFPKSVIIVEFLISSVLLVGSRFFVKLLYLESFKSKDIEERVVIYGAGISGLMTKRTIEKNIDGKQKIIAFIDDNKKMNGNRLEGVTIFHTSKLGKLLKNEGFTHLIVAIQKPQKESLKKVADFCLENKINIKKVPSLKSWINGEFSTKQISSVKINDLLGRKQIVLDEKKIKNELNNQVVLVTGAAGSIGSGMVRQIAKYNPKKLILLDQAESPLYDLQNELVTEFKELNFDVVIGDIRNYERMRNLFETLYPKFVFHAAAYKHVPLMEDNPTEAVLTNISGTKNLVDLSMEFKVDKFVMISTDKAVNPTNVMGASKRIAEIYAQFSNGKSATKFITTRFGNVLGSNGSVIPLFQRQIDSGGPLTVTDERVTRFFMTIPEACQLVLEAGTMGEGGEIFVFDMGESVKIIDLAKKMIKLSGLELGKDIEIKITGLRPGEKLYEELLANGENTMPTHHKQILRAKVRVEEESKIEQIKELIALFYIQNNEEIVRKMKDIVPEFVSNNSSFEKLDK